MNRPARKKPRAKKRGLRSSGMIAAVLCAVFVLAGIAHEARAEEVCENPDARKIYDRMKSRTMARKSYTATYFHASERGRDHEVFSRMRCAGKYTREPDVYYETRLWLEASFPEQAGAGYQEIYTAADDLNRILMPGALRMLGVLSMFPEDPKADYLNGENMNKAAVWTWFSDWDRMMEGGRLEASCDESKGPYWLLTIHRGNNPDPLYHHDLVKIRVDRETMFPMRVEAFTPGDRKPVMVYEFEKLALDPGLTGDDIEFEGLAPGWDLASMTVPGGDKPAALKKKEPKLTDADLEPEGFMNQLDPALAAINDYETIMTISLRYRRLRQYKQEKFLFLKKDRAFSARTIALQANYILLNAGEGFRTVFDPERDKLLHVIPAGVFRVMGEQTFPLDDPRLFSAPGDNVTGLDFFAIRAQLAKRLENAKTKRTANAAYGNASGPWIEVVEAGPAIPKRPAVMRLLLDRDTRLPRILEFTGFDDPDAFLLVSFENTVVNKGMNRRELWE